MERVSARDLIIEAFGKLAQKKSVDRITVRDICREAGVSTVTFYNHFSNKAEMYSTLGREMAEAQIARLGEGYTWSDYLHDVLTANIDAGETLRNLVGNTQGYEGFLENSHQSTTHALSARIARDHPGHPDDRELTALRTYSYGLVHMLGEWIMRGMPRDTGELVEGLCDAFPRSLSIYIPVR